MIDNPVKSMPGIMSEEIDDWKPPTEAELKVLEAKRERSDKISKLMGDYLLKGYTMLGNTCPECETILLRDKQDHIYCVACNELDTDADKDDPALNSEAARRATQEQEQRNLVTPPDSPIAPRVPRVNIGVENGYEEPNSTTSHSPIFGRRAAGDGQTGLTGLMGATARPVFTQNIPSGVKPKQKDTPAPSSRRPAGTGTADDGPPSTSRTVFGTSTSSPASVSAQSTPDSKPPPLLVTLNMPSNPLPNPALDLYESIEVVNRKLQWGTLELQRATSVDNSIQLCNLIKVCAETLAILQQVQQRNA